MTADWPRVDETSVSDRTVATDEPASAGDEPVATNPQRSGLSPWALVPVAGLVWWVVGFAPWIVDGLGGAVFSGKRTAVPLYVGNLSTMVLSGGLGALAAGATVLLARGSTLARIAAVVAGVVLAAVVTVGQSFAALRDPSLDNVSTADRVLIGLTAVVAASTLVGLVWGLLVLTGPVGSGLALAGAAGAVPLWLTNLLLAAGIDVQDDVLADGQVGRWVGAALLAAGLIRIGARPTVRLVAWPVAIVLAWCIGPTITAAGYMEQLLRPGTVLSDVLDEQVSLSWQVWRMAASLDARPLTPWVAALVVAGLVAVLLRRRDPPSGDDPVA